MTVPTMMSGIRTINVPPRVIFARSDNSRIRMFVSLFTGSQIRKDALCKSAGATAFFLSYHMGNDMINTTGARFFGRFIDNEIGMQNPMVMMPVLHACPTVSISLSIFWMCCFCADCLLASFLKSSIIKRSL